MTRWPCNKKDILLYINLECIQQVFLYLFYNPVDKKAKYDLI